MPILDWFYTAKPPPQQTYRGPSFHGTWIVALGPPRRGKTHVLTELACAASLTYGLPLIAQDPTGNLAVRIEGFRQGSIERIRQARSKVEIERGETELAFFSDRERCRLFPGGDTADMLRAIRTLVGDGCKSTTRWQAVVMLDEGAIIREYDEQFFDAVAPLFGNAGIIGYVTEQREVGVPPSLRACIRRYLLWAGAGRETPVGGWVLDNRTLTRPMGRSIVHMDPSDGRLDTWEMDTDDYPLELITPAKLSLPIKETIL
jgi:hypothetical protein